MSTHGSSSVSLVEAAANILGCELEVAVFANAEDLCGPHGRRIRLSEVTRNRKGKFNLRRSAGFLVDNRGLEGV